MSRLNVANFRHPDGTDDNINLTSTGRVGIGTTSPTASLQVNGTGQIARFESDSSSAVVRLANTGTNPCEFIYTNELAINVGGSERTRIDSSGNLRFNSGYGSVATAYGVRAWVNFDGTSGSIGTGDANGNISGVTDLGTGDYTIAIDNDMPDANYVIAGHVNAHQAWGGMVINSRADGSVGTKTAGSFSLATIDGDSARDYTDVGVLVIR